MATALDRDRRTVNGRLFLMRTLLCAGKAYLVAQVPWVQITDADIKIAVHASNFLLKRGIVPETPLFDPRAFVQALNVCTRFLVAYLRDPPDTENPIDSVIAFVASSKAELCVQYCEDVIASLFPVFCLPVPQETAVQDVGLGDADFAGAADA